MTSKNTKIFTIDNSEYQFDFSAFNIMFNKHCQFCHIKKSDFEEELAEKLNVTPMTISRRIESNAWKPVEIFYMKHKLNFNL